MAITMSRRLGLAVLLGCGTVCLLVALTCSDAAIAAKHHSRVSAVSTPTLGVGPTPANYDVTCPRGLKAVGGGFNTSGISIAGPLVPGGSAIAVVPVVYESRRLNARTWRVTEKAALNPAVPSFAPRGTTVTASVYCRKVKGRVTAVEGLGSSSTTPSSPSTADPRCPKGRVAVGGGWSVQLSDERTPSARGFFLPSIYESFRDGSRRWRTSAVPSSGETLNTFGLVYCAHERKPPRTIRRTVSSGAASVRCGGGLAAAAGGFQTTPGAVIQTSIGSSGGRKRSYPPGTTYPAGPSWMVGTDPIDGPSTPIMAFAYCS